MNPYQEAKALRDAGTPFVIRRNKTVEGVTSYDWIEYVVHEFDETWIKMSWDGHKTDNGDIVHPFNINHDIWNTAPEWRKWVDLPRFQILEV